MNRGGLRLFCWSGLVMACMIVAGCAETVEIGELIEESRSVEMGDVRSVQADITMGLGKLMITGGADDLMEADLTYNVPKWKPELDYWSRGEEGHLVLRQPSSRDLGWSRRMRYEWDLKFKDGVPLDFDVELGAGQSYLELGSLTIRSLDLDAGAGEVEIDLTGQPTVEELDIKTGAGSVTVDLTGQWRADLEASISGGVGKLVLRLPRDVGVRVDVDKGIGRIKADGFRRRGGAYVNEAYGESDVTLRIDCQTGIGEIILELRESGGRQVII
jgi:hypothetical protein